MADHASRSDPADRPLLTRFLEMDMDERWVDRSPVEMLETFPWFQGECFELIVDDLLSLASADLSSRTDVSEAWSRRQRGGVGAPPPLGSARAQGPSAGGASPRGQLANGPGVVAEGFRLLPDRVAPLLGPSSRAVWLLPTPEFRRAASESRGGGWEFLDDTSDPGKARRNLMERDRMFTEFLRDETRRLGLAAIEVDHTMTEDELVERVTRVLER